MMRKSLALIGLLAFTTIATAVPYTFYSGPDSGSASGTGSLSFGGSYDDALGAYGSISILSGGYGGLGAPATYASIIFPSGPSITLNAGDFGGFGTLLGFGSLASADQKADLLAGLAYVQLLSQSGDLAANILFPGGSSGTGGSGGNTAVPDGGVSTMLLGVVLLGLAASAKFRKT